jgi:5-oxoprolinase (ATP-hydrolysing) subunit A
MTAPSAIDLNADLGETEGDLVLMSVVTSANIACGGHAGDRSSMAAAVEAALAEGVAIGAHPSYADREGFGRVELGLAPAEIAVAVAEQVGCLGEIAARAGARIAYVKLHGALYHRAGSDLECAESILDAIERLGSGPSAVLAQPRAAMLVAAKRRGWVGVEEGFCDRLYRPDGTLADRREPGSVIEQPATAARQAVSLAVEGGTFAGDGTWVALRPASLCLHGDTPGALDAARAIRKALEAAGVAVAAFSAPRVPGTLSGPTPGAARPAGGADRNGGG